MPKWFFNESLPPLMVISIEPEGHGYPVNFIIREGQKWNNIDKLGKTGGMLLLVC